MYFFHKKGVFGYMIWHIALNMRIVVLSFHGSYDKSIALIVFKNLCAMGFVR